MSGTKQPRIQKTNLDEKYEKYVMSIGEPTNLPSGSLNLFSDYNKLDRAWFHFANTYINTKVGLKDGTQNKRLVELFSISSPEQS